MVDRHATRRAAGKEREKSEQQRPSLMLESVCLGLFLAALAACLLSDYTAANGCAAADMVSIGNPEACRSRLMAAKRHRDECGEVHAERLCRAAGPAMMQPMEP
jgi:hypothetical protein